MSRNGVAGFKSERLQQIMTVRRLTQVQLAALVGVSTATMSKWKTGLHSPDAETLERLASVLNVTSEWFTRTVQGSVAPPLFRSNASAHKQARLMLEERLKLTDEIVMHLSEYLDMPALNLPQRNFRDPLSISQEDIEEAAIEFRQKMQLGNAPIPDLLLAVESSGVVVVREVTDISAIEGLSTWSRRSGYPLILLSADKANAFRSRFDLAHELGHLILHKHIDVCLRNHENHKLLEQQAHAFAGALLLPADSFPAKIRLPTTLDDLLIQKQYWGVSVAAMIMRLHNLNLIDDDIKANMFKRRSVRWGAKSEPGDKDRKPEEPKLLRRSIELLVQEKILQIEHLHTYFGLGKQDLINLLNLQEDYFEPQKSKIIPFMRIKSQLFNG